MDVQIGIHWPYCINGQCIGCMPTRPKEEVVIDSVVIFDDPPDFPDFRHFFKRL
jgi:hypothetical protein